MKKNLEFILHQCITLGSFNSKGSLPRAQPFRIADPW